MKDSKVTFSSLDYEVINMQKHKQTQSNYSWYIFLSKDFCKACFLETIPKWEMMINNTKKRANISYYFIVDSDDFDEVRKNIQEIGITYPVYLDVNGCFFKKKDFIPREPIFHVFLTNKKGNILLVGDPLKSKKVERLFYKILESN